MAIDWTGVKSAIRGWFLPATGLADGAVIWANQTGPRPAVPFAEINFRAGITRLGAYDEERLDPNTAGNIIRVAQRKLTVSCHTYGPGAIALMETAQEALDTYAARSALASGGLYVSDRGKIQDLTKLLETTFEERAQLDVVFALAAITNENVGAAAQISINGTFTNPDGQTSETFTVTSS